MSFKENLRIARERMRLTQQDLADLIHVSRSTYCNYESGKREPDVKKIKEISEILNITSDELLDTHTIKSSLGAFTKEEKDMIYTYRGLDKHGRELVDIVLEKEHVRCAAPPQPVLELISNEQPVDSIEFYSPVSAGYGADLSDTADAKHVKLLPNWYTKQADYIVRVDGESMAPRFHHNDRLLVQEADDTEIGEIGIWVINGKHFVKKKGEGKLISLNRDYPDVYPEDDYEQRCQGRVIGVLDPSWILEE